jgi:hypothetical protein
VHRRQPRQLHPPQQFTHAGSGSTSPAITAPVHAVHGLVSAQRGTTAVTILRQTIDGTAIGEHTLTGGYAMYEAVAGTHPDGSAWTPATVSAAEFGVETVSGTNLDVTMDRLFVPFEAPTAALPSPTPSGAGPYRPICR